MDEADLIDEPSRLRLFLDRTGLDEHGRQALLDTIEALCDRRIRELPPGSHDALRSPWQRALLAVGIERRRLIEQRWDAVVERPA